MATKIDIFEDKWCEMVFTDRNKEYGAYELRKSYAKNSILGIILAIILFSISVSAPLIIKLITDNVGNNDLVKITEVINMEEPPPIDEKQPPPPPVEPPPPIKETIKFTPPVIRPDKEVTEELPPVEVLKEVDAGVETQEGNGVEGLEEEVVVGADDNQVFLSVEKMPEFPGGEQALFEYLQKSIKYPPIARENGISGTVYLSFVIGKDGKPGDIKILRALGGGCDEEAIRVVKAMPQWSVGMQNGRPAQVQFQVPIKFKLL